MSVNAADRSEQKDPPLNSKLLWLGALLLAAVGIIVYATTRPTTPPPTSSNYFTGPAYNKRGDLVTDDGKIIQRAANPRKLPQNRLPEGLK